MTHSFTDVQAAVHAGCGIGAWAFSLHYGCLFGAMVRAGGFSNVYRQNPNLDPVAGGWYNAARHVTTFGTPAC